MQTTILIADDHPMFAEGLASLLQSDDEYRVIGYAYDGAEAVRKVQELHPDIAIVDVNMPELDGIEATAQIRREHPTTRVIMLTMNDETSLITQAIEAGAHAYMLKNSAKADLFAALRAVRADKQYFSAGVAQILLQKELARNKPDNLSTALGEEILTPREIAVAKLLVQDLTNAEIADRLFISIRTVEGHRMNILRKLNLKSVVGLAKYAAQQGWAL
jgi:DNA-binding NarL/FixJ family response regulator